MKLLETHEARYVENRKVKRFDAAFAKIENGILKLYGWPREGRSFTFPPDRVQDPEGSLSKSYVYDL